MPLLFLIFQIVGKPILMLQSALLNPIFDLNLDHPSLFFLFLAIGQYPFTFLFNLLNSGFQLKYPHSCLFELYFLTFHLIL